MLNIKAPDNVILKPVITVFGVGGAGGNAINNMIRCNLKGVDFVVANTDAQALSKSGAKVKIQLGAMLTKGLGAGASPEIGKDAAIESEGEILTHLEGSNMVFVTAGMGGGTGTGASPIIAKLAKDLGILTVGVVTKPFVFEGNQRMKIADSGINELQKHVDTLIVIQNQNLFRLANEKTTFSEAFDMADEVLHDGIRSVTDLMTAPGLINLDFADIQTVMAEQGKAMMGSGEAEGEDRATKAAESAIANPLLDQSSMCGACGVLINITGGEDVTLYEVDCAANRIKDEVGKNDANIIFGSTLDPELKNRIRVSVVATGIDQDTSNSNKSIYEAGDHIEDDITEQPPAYEEDIILEDQIQNDNHDKIYNNHEDDKTSDSEQFTNTQHVVQNNSTLKTIWNLFTSALNSQESNNIKKQKTDSDVNVSSIKDKPTFFEKE